MKSISISQAPGRRSGAYFWAAALSLAVFGVAAPATASSQSLSADTLLAHVRYLASDALGGREAGEPGADSAAAYIARRMEAYGLTPLGTEGYLQSFEITTTINISGQSQLILQTPDGSRRLELYREWLPFSFSSPGRVRGPAFAAGYGLDAESFGSSPGADLSGKVVVMRGGAPEGFNPHSGADATPRFKATSARHHGAPAVIVTVPNVVVPQAGNPPQALGIPAAQVLENAEILALLDSDELIITLDAALEPIRARAYNVVGFVAGRDPALRDEVIVIGAHYDHLGMGGPGSLAPEAHEPHNGADDNASGAALTLELARYFSSQEHERPARSLVFVTFSAEEMGLLGSEHFVERTPIALERISAMINFDMVGRLRDGKLQIFGTGTAQEVSDILDSLAASSPLSLTKTADGYGPSDQTSFYARGIPVLHLFTGVHSQYHRPDDDWELINAEGMAEVAGFALALIKALGDRPQGLTPVRQSRPTAGGGGGYGPYLGTIPDFGDVEGGGVRLTGVRTDSPAEGAGLQGGDVIIEFAGREVLNLYDYTYALRAHAPGDTVSIKIKRDGRELELTAVLGRRQ